MPPGSCFRADLHSFGPDWDDHAAALDTEADRLSGDRDGYDSPP